MSLFSVSGLVSSLTASFKVSLSSSSASEVTPEVFSSFASANVSKTASSSASISLGISSSDASSACLFLRLKIVSVACMNDFTRTVEKRIFQLELRDDRLVESESAPVFLIFSRVVTNALA